MEDSVECYSSHTYAEMPVALYWQGQRLAIAEIEKSWWSPDSKHFRVRTNEDREFELIYSLDNDQWNISPR